MMKCLVATTIVFLLTLQTGCQQDSVTESIEGLSVNPPSTSMPPQDQTHLGANHAEPPLPTNSVPDEKTIPNQRTKLAAGNVVQQAEPLTRPKDSDLSLDTSQPRSQPPQAIAPTQPGPVPAKGIPFMARRRAFRTNLLKKGRAPAQWSELELRAGYREITYRSGALNLKAYLNVPKDTRKPRPAIVHFHGGFNLSNGHFYTMEWFVNAGYVVLVPTLRGENGNPGTFEMFYGELEDAVATINWLHAQPYVDKNRIYAFGHSAGGIITGLLSLVEGIPLRHSAGAGGIYAPSFFPLLADSVPFDLSNPEESALRVLPGNIGWMQRKHYVFAGQGDVNVMAGVAEVRREIEGYRSLIELTVLPGDHYTSLHPAAHEYLKITERDAQ